MITHRVHSVIVVAVVVVAVIFTELFATISVRNPKTGPNNSEVEEKENLEITKVARERSHPAKKTCGVETIFQHCCPTVRGVFRML